MIAGTASAQLPSETPPPTGERRPGRGLRDFGEDTTGFGELEARTVWHTIVRPAAVLDAYMTAGPTGGGRYSRPLRFYLGLNAVLMLILFLMGGAGLFIEGLPAEALAPFIEASGKSREVFVSDADGWMSLVLVPLLSVFYVLAVIPLVRWWDPDDLGWRRGFRAALVYMNTLTVPMIPLSWFLYDQSKSGIGLAVTIGLSIYAFFRAGRARWYRSTAAGLGRGLVIALAIQLAALVGSFPLMIVGILGGLYGA